MRVYVSQLPQIDRLILAGDHTAWSRLWAETTPERSYQHQPSPIPGRRPITIGHGYSTLAVIPELEGSWALLLLHERIAQQKPVLQASQQLRAVCQALPMRAASLWDSEYRCAAFVKATADIAVDKVIRLRTNLALEGPPKPYLGRGARRKHGPKFKLRDPVTWWAPGQVLEVDDPDFGPMVVRLWSELRFRQALECPTRVAQIERLQAPHPVAGLDWAHAQPHSGGACMPGAIRWTIGIASPKDAYTGPCPCSPASMKPNTGRISCP